MDRLLRGVLYGDPIKPGTPEKWSNDRCMVIYDKGHDCWVYWVPGGRRQESDVREVVLDAIKPYL